MLNVCIVFVCRCITLDAVVKAEVPVVCYGPKCATESLSTNQTSYNTAHTADMFDGFSYLTCKAVMFYQRCMSSIADADRADNKAARLAPEVCLMFFIFQTITYAEIAVKIDSDMKRYRAKIKSSVALGLSVAHYVFL